MKASPFRMKGGAFLNDFGVDVSHETKTSVAKI
jgi:hypothetical protein